jgi:outer membrane protein
MLPHQCFLRFTGLSLSSKRICRGSVMTSMKLAIGAALGALAIAAPAQAQEASRWFVHLGPALVSPDESATMTAGGQPLPGANVSIDSRWTVEGEIGYFITPNIAVAVAAGFPPTFKVETAGTLAGMGTAGEMTGGPAGVMLQYHFNRQGRIQPYIGGGASFLVVFGTKDGVMTNLKAKSAIGTALQAGVDVMFDDRLGMFVDVKKAWVGTVATGSMGPAPVRAKVNVDPIVTNVGLTYRF